MARFLQEWKEPKYFNSRPKYSPIEQLTIQITREKVKDNEPWGDIPLLSSTEELTKATVMA